MELEREAEAAEHQRLRQEAIDRGEDPDALDLTPLDDKDLHYSDKNNNAGQLNGTQYYEEEEEYYDGLRQR